MGGSYVNFLSSFLSPSNDSLKNSCLDQGENVCFFPNPAVFFGTINTEDWMNKRMTRRREREREGERGRESGKKGLKCEKHGKTSLS